MKGMDWVCRHSGNVHLHMGHSSGSLQLQAAVFCVCKASHAWTFLKSRTYMYGQNLNRQI